MNTFSRQSMIISVCSCCLILNFIMFYIFIDVNVEFQYEFDLSLNALQMIERAGYPAECHMVTTEDGYILEMHRIPGSIGSVPVFLQHELFGSSNLWLILGENRSLAYLLANEGYDVWMGNNRGTTYGKSHKNMSNENSQFWMFSQHELGVYDLPAEISYITNFTSQPIILIGFSMGSPVSLITVSELPDMKSKIRLMIHLAPAVYISQMKQGAVLAKIAASFAKELQVIFDLIGIQQIPPAPHLIRLFIKYFCTLSKVQAKICQEILMAILGFDTSQFDLDMVAILLNYAPETTSNMVLMHYAQWFQSKQFRQYDYGIVQNLNIYNNTIPPDYNLTKVHIPNIIFYAENDWFADVKDILKLYDKLPIKAGLIKVNYTECSHLDFRIACDSPALVYNHIIKVMKDYC